MQLLLCAAHRIDEQMLRTTLVTANCAHGRHCALAGIEHLHCRGGPLAASPSAPTGSAPTRRAASIARSTRLLLSSDLVALVA